MNNEYLSREGLEKLKNELDNLRTVKRKEIAEKLKYAKSLGDLSENAEYKETIESQLLLEDKIVKLEDIIKRAVVVEKSGGPNIQIGSFVILKKENGKTVKDIDYTIVGQEEADITAGKISSKSPIGAALMGRRKGDIVVVKTPAGENKYAIVSVA